MQDRLAYAVQIASGLASCPHYIGKGIDEIVDRALRITDALMVRAGTPDELKLACALDIANLEASTHELFLRPNPVELGSILLFGATPLAVAIARLCSNAQVRGLCVFVDQPDHHNGPYAKILKGLKYDLLVGDLDNREFLTLVNCSKTDVPEEIGEDIPTHLAPIDICRYFPGSPFVASVIGESRGVPSR